MVRLSTGFVLLALGRWLMCCEPQVKKLKASDDGAVVEEEEQPKQASGCPFARFL